MYDFQSRAEVNGHDYAASRLLESQECAAASGRFRMWFDVMDAHSLHNCRLRAVLTHKHCGNHHQTLDNHLRVLINSKQI
jgi:hypothetical protein